jgi:5-methyltetrahydrofolate--homocysteine methyltransferase
MKIPRFIVVGENIHCTRILKVGGKSVVDVGGGKHAIVYKAGAQDKQLPVPEIFTKTAGWQDGKVKHCAVGIWQGVYGDSAAKAAGIDYIQNMAKQQEKTGAAFLDINVDEFSTDVAERVKLMKWTVDIVQKAVKIPVSVDSSNTDILRAGLEASDKSRARPMVNSVSLERANAIAVAAEFKASVIASAAGEKDLPSSTTGRLENLGTLMRKLKDAGFDSYDRIYIDPLVFPISTDGNNGKGFLDAVSAARAKYGNDIHICAGLSNVSFGMPSRKIINQVFAWLAVEAGADGGIVDPAQINGKILEGLDTESEGFKLAKALLLGEDEFGMNFISAAREGKI